MAISAFFGLQTSLRGLLAQQQALDITGHNIANANTAGYSRQEAVLSRRARYLIPANSVNNGAGRSSAAASTSRRSGASATSSSTSSTARRGEPRRRDRAHELARPGRAGLRRAERRRHPAQLSRFWNAWSDVANAPERRRARAARS